MRVSGLAANLALQFAITRSVYRSEWGAGGSERLRIGDAARGAEDAEELVALTTHTAEHAELLENHGPGNNGKKKKENEHAARHPSGIGENAAQVD